MGCPPPARRARSLRWRACDDAQPPPALLTATRELFFYLLKTTGTGRLAHGCVVCVCTPIPSPPTATSRRAAERLAAARAAELVAALRALRDGEDFIKSQLDLWRSNMDVLEARFAGHNRIIMPRPQSTFYSFFKIDGEDDCMQLARNLIDEVELGLAPGCAFGQSGAGFMRLCFAVSEDKLNEALDRLERYLG